MRHLSHLFIRFIRALTHRPREDWKKTKLHGKQKLKSAWPLIRELITPRKGLLALGLLLMAINRVAGLVLPYMTRFLVDNVVTRHQVQLLKPIVGAVVIATLAQGLTSYALTQSLSKAAQRLIAELRRKVQAHVSRLPVGFYDANKTGNLVSRIMQDVEGVRNLIGTGLVEFFGGLMTAAISLVLLLYISASMTVLAIAALGFFSVFLKRAFKTIRPIFKERARINAEVSGRLTESLGGVRVVKGYHAESREQTVFSSGVERLLQNMLRTLTATSLMSLSSSVLMGVVGATVMFLGARQIITGHMTIGQFFQYTLFLGFLVMPVVQVVAIGTQITDALAGLERTRELLEEKPEHTDLRRVILLHDIVGQVQFNEVRFTYDGGKEILHGISFDAQPGTVMALVGSSGSGKSTIIGLIAAFHNPDSGAVYVDGIDLATVRLESYRTRLGVVLQDSFLFDGTILENVAFSRPDASDDEIMEACRFARVDEFAEEFEGKYDTVVGERGVKLSGGQRQRLSIARAILADPRILILDEATSSLDSESEHMIQQGLAYLMRGRTTFVIAHRLSTIRRADQILVVEAGEVVERGTHEELLAASGRYCELYTKQHGLEMNLFLAPGEGDTVPETEKAAAARETGASPNVGPVLSARVAS